MSSTNKTANYELSQFLATDVPAWLVDYNGDMSKIDTGMKVNAVAAAAAQSSANAADSKADAAVADVAAIETVLETPNTGVLARISSAENDIDTIQSLIGNGEPTTTDKTIIGAINELYDDITGGGTIEIQAGNVSYDNTGSGLSATSVQEAIDEIASAEGDVLPMRMIVVGDSYAVDATTPSPNFADNLKTIFNLGTSDFYNISARGIGIVQENSDSKDTLDILQENASLVTNPTTITHVVITPGVNDTKTVDPDDIPAAVTNLVAYIRTTYPNAKIYYGFIGNFLSSPNAVGVTGFARYTKAMSVLYESFKHEKVHVMSGIECICHDASNLGSDLTHPSLKGSRNIANFIAQCIEYGSSKYYASYDITDAHSNTVSIVFDGDQVMIKYPYYAPNAAFANGVAKFIEFVNSPLMGLATDSIFFNDFASVDGTNAIHHFRIREGDFEVIQSGATTLGYAGNGFAVMNTLTV